MKGAGTSAARIAAVLVAMSIAASALAQKGAGLWDGLANGGPRLSTVAHPPVSPAPAWTRSTDADGNPISFIGQAPTAVSAHTVFAVGRVSPPGQTASQARLFAFSRDTGQPRWWASIPAIVLESASGPALDERAGTVIVASQRAVSAFDQGTGALRWQATLGRSIVNASPLVVAEPGRPTRVFITDYDGFGTAARLYCINAGSTSPGNPFQPGEIVWSVPIGGSSGNSPAYQPLEQGGIGFVYTASTGDGGGTPGKILAFDAFAMSPPAPAFSFVNPGPEGFFGGISILPPAMNGQPPKLLAASYSFSGDLASANLVKVNAATGALVWSTPCNRTQSIPIPLPGGRIALATGIYGFGSLPALELFMDHGQSASLLWNSSIATWTDANGNGAIDTGEYTAIGGWTQQPVVSTFAGKAVLCAGVVPATGTTATPCPELFSLDLDEHPASTTFVRWRLAGPGGTPASAGASLISIGPAGLVHLGPTPAMLDISSDALVSTADLYEWESGQTRDLDLDGEVTGADRGVLTSAIRAGERGAMSRGRP